MPTSTKNPEPKNVTLDLLRGWPLPEIAETKRGRGDVVVVGGARKSPGAAMLAGVAALRVGAGRLTLAIAQSVAPHVAAALPECGVVALAETPQGHVAGAGVVGATSELRQASAVLAGPGLDDADEAAALLERLPGLATDTATVILDAFALGVLPRVPGAAWALSGRLILTPNLEEASRLLGREIDDMESNLAEIAREFRCVVTCYGLVCDPAGAQWKIDAGSGGLATSGSGDVLAGAIAGLAARGATPSQAAVWGTFLHATAGDRLDARIGPVGYLASELLTELPGLLVEASPPTP